MSNRPRGQIYKTAYELLSVGSVSAFFVAVALLAVGAYRVSG